MREARPTTDRPQGELRILFVGTQMALGGAQRLLLDQATWFAAHGHRVTAAFFYDKQGLGGTWRQGITFPLITLSNIGAKAGLARRILGLAAAMLRLWRLMRAGKFDALVTFTYDSNLLALPLAWLAGVPARIATHHGIIEGFPRLFERMHAALVNRGIASILVNVSRKVLEQSAAVGIRREHMTVIPNGIPPGEAGETNGGARRRELGIRDGDVMLLSVGRLVYQKGHEFLVEAVGLLRKDYPNVKAVICGDGPLRAQLEAQLGRLSLSGLIQMPGNRLDIDRYLRAADVFVLPSRWEGLPVALLEAMDAGLPVVATRVEGVEEVVHDRIHGLLVQPEDARALAESIRTLIADPGLRASIAAGAKQRVRESYTTDIMCEKYLSLMLKLQPRGRSGGSS